MYLTDVWDGRSKFVTEGQSGASDVGRKKTKQTPEWIFCQLGKLEKNRSRLNKKMIKKSSAFEVICIPLRI